MFFDVFVNHFLFILGFVFAPLHIAVSVCQKELTPFDFKTEFSKPSVDEAKRPKTPVFFGLLFHILHFNTSKRLTILCGGAGVVKYRYGKRLDKTL